MKREDRIRAAKAALQNEAVLHALAEIQRDAFNAFVGSSLLSRDEREISYLRVRAVNEVRTLLENWSNEGNT